MAFDFTFTASDYDKQDEFSPLPAGDYEVIIEKCEQTRTKTTGKDMLKLTMKVISGKSINRKIYDYIVDNEFAKEKVMRVIKAAEVKVQRFSPTCLNNKNVIVEVNLEDGKNNVKKYKQMPKVTDEIPMGNIIDPNLAPPLDDEPPF
jgi:hypothetical protein